MVIEMADRSMQSPKGMVENILVKIHNFIFPVDFVILDIIKDNKVPILLGRPMLATTYARIDVFGGKTSLEDNDLLPDYEDLGATFLSPNKSLGGNWDPVGEFQDSNDKLSIGIYDFVAIDDL
ncbi:putative reverse transcriptase domain-containing protein [Tanacetum coccineum]